MAKAVFVTVISAIEANVGEKGELIDPFKYPNGKIIKDTCYGRIRQI